VPATDGQPARIVALSVFVGVDETNHETARVFARLVLAS